MNAKPTLIPPPEAVALTIYNQDLALIRERRVLDIQAGTASYLVPEVSGRLKPDTVHLSLPEGVSFSLLEQNFDYDLVSSDKLLEKFIGRELLVVDDEHDSQLAATLLSTSGGRIVKDGDGRILIDPPGRVILPPGAADELLLRPTLSWSLWSQDAGQRQAELSYLSAGLSWEASYVVLLNADDTAGDFEGWVTITNRSGTTYHDANLKLVAGDVHLVHKRPERPQMKDATLRGAAMAPEGFEEEELFEYHLYDLPRTTTIRDNQLKQIGLLTAPGVAFTKRLVFDGLRGGDVRVGMEFTNSEEAGLGMPLPAGIVRVFKQDSDGDPQFLGEDRIDHTPKDEERLLYIGNAFDVVGETVRTEYSKQKRGFTASHEVTLRNHKDDEDVTVIVVARFFHAWKITASSHDLVQKDAQTAEFHIPVKADGEAVLTFSLKADWR